jgi:hypothetical protein
LRHNFAQLTASHKFQHVEPILFGELAAKLCVCGFGEIGRAKKPTLSLADALAIPLPLRLFSHQQFHYLQSPVAVAMVIGQSVEKCQSIWFPL